MSYMVQINSPHARAVVAVGGLLGAGVAYNKFQLYRKEPLSFVLVGVTGHGKSSSGNTLSGTNRFTVSNSVMSVTKKAQSVDFLVGDHRFRAIDLPGFLDTNKPLGEIQRELADCASYSGGHVVSLVIVIRRGVRATEDIQKVTSYVQQQFGEEALQKHAIVLFTDTFESPDDIRRDAQGLPEENSYRRLVSAMPTDRIFTLQNGAVWPRDHWKMWAQRRMVLDKIVDVFNSNESEASGPRAHLDCEAFRKKRLEDEETKLKQRIVGLEADLKQASRSGGINCNIL